jgi:hypothetical protein
MADDKTKRGKQDRSKVAGGEKYEVAYVAKKFGVPQAEVKAVQKKVGPSRERVEAELKKRSGR